MFAKSKRGFGADGAFPTLLAVVNHYDSCFKLGQDSAGEERPRPVSEEPVEPDDNRTSVAHDPNRLRPPRLVARSAMAERARA
jgi:hypothetical protein